MTTYKKLKIAILTILASQNLYAINVNPVVIQSSVGELLYAELNFNQADKSLPIEVSLASIEDLTSIGAMHSPPDHLNFYTRYNTDGSGVITITSSRPIIEKQLDFIVKIKQGSATRLQHIQKNLASTNNHAVHLSAEEKSLTPILIVNEQDIVLDLPISTQMTSPDALKPAKTAPSSHLATEKPLVIAQTPAPSVNTEVKSEKPVVSPNPNTSQNIKPQSKQSVTVPQTKKDDRQKPNQPEEKQVAANKATNSTNRTHAVQKNESLWLIASQVAKENNQSVTQVMQKIKNDNKDAFIQGDMNRLKSGVTLNIDMTGLSKSASTGSQKSVKQSGTAKYRLDQAQLSILTDEQTNPNNSAENSSSMSKTSTQLAKKVMTSREKTVKLQSNVTQLETSLGYKDQRIQLLNARLAQLQQQLKKQQAVKRPQS